MECSVIEKGVKIDWVNQPPAKKHQGRKPANMIPHEKSGQVVGDALYCLTEVECWELFFSKGVTNIILAETNRNIRKYNDMRPGKKEVDSLELLEFRAFLGLFYACGFFSWNYESYERLWDVPRLNAIFVATMSLPRFKQLLQFLAFDNKETRDERYKSDKMAACREVFEVFNDNCGKPLMPSP